ncbi:hypothetical protein CFOL_v3_35334 [Cephalotus follicularis]|uniref:Uncharacterized protein n=1 Tax=Cephalotus follicularis TaxID=3775 RepID=A0A1Q3DHQ8_CEPFO|nr:hypothetical protein CFOL_v3_35334 [Cephalotus follicularis]
MPEADLIQPPPLKRLPGRPTVNRKREAGEPVAGIKRSSTVRCGICGGLAHNKRKCQRAPVMKKVNCEHMICVFYIICVEFNLFFVLLKYCSRGFQLLVEVLVAYMHHL